MTTNRLQFCLATALALGAAEATARAQAAAPQSPSPPPAAAAPTPAAGQAQYPAGQPYPAQPNAGQPYQGQGQGQGQGQPYQGQGQPYPAQPNAGQPYQGQPYPAQPYQGQGQPYPGQPYPGQPYQGQPYQGQGQPYQGQGQPYQGQPYPGQPYQGQPYPGQPYAGPPPALNTTVHIDATDHEATLFQHTGSSAFVGYAYRGAMVGTVDFWQRICRAPCDQPVDTNATYSLRGNGIVPSGPFSLPVGQVRVNAHVGHSGMRVGGWILSLMGGATLLSGLGLVGMGALFNSINDKSDPSLARSGGSYMTAGGVMMGIGAGALAGGIVMMVKSRTLIQINGEPSAQLHLPSGRSLYVNAHGLAF